MISSRRFNVFRRSSKKLSDPLDEILKLQIAGKLKNRYFRYLVLFNIKNVEDLSIAE